MRNIQWFGPLVAVIFAVGMRPVQKRPDYDPERRPHGHRRGWSDDDFFGLDVDRMSSRAQVRVALTVLALVLVGAVAVFALVPWLWWLIFTFGWMIFPAFGLLVRGIAGTSEDRPELLAANSKERELLGALHEHGELTPARAAMETSLTVAEADEMLKELAEGGHLDVRVRGGGIFYALWEPGGEDAGRELEGRG
jgi:hypothetical protein